MAILKIKDENGVWINVPALKGDPGYTPIKGVDYFDGAPGEDYVLTEADKQEIADMIEVPGGTVPDNVLTTDDMDEITAAVIAALPIYNGEVEDL